MPTRTTKIKIVNSKGHIGSKTAPPVFSSYDLLLLFRSIRVRHTVRCNIPQRKGGGNINLFIIPCRSMIHGELHHLGF